MGYVSLKVEILIKFLYSIRMCKWNAKIPLKICFKFLGKVWKRTFQYVMQHFFRKF